MNCKFCGDPAVVTIGKVKTCERCAGLVSEVKESTLDKTGFGEQLNLWPGDVLEKGLTG
jgi:hypothetical protein